MGAIACRVRVRVRVCAPNEPARAGSMALTAALLPIRPAMTAAACAATAETKPLSGRPATPKPSVAAAAVPARECDGAAG